MAKKTSKRKPKRRSAKSRWPALGKSLSMAMAALLSYGGYQGADALGWIPDFKTKKQKALAALESERKKVEKAKKECPELYEHPVDFYLKDLKDAYDKAPDTR